MRVREKEAGPSQVRKFNSEVGCNNPLWKMGFGHEDNVKGHGFISLLLLYPPMSTDDTVASEISMHGVSDDSLAEENQHWVYVTPFASVFRPLTLEVSFFSICMSEFLTAF